MKRLLAVCSALALVTLFILVPPAPHVPIPPDSSTLQTRETLSTFTLNAPTPIFQSVTGQEITVNHQSFFLDANGFFSNGLDNFDRTLLGNLKVAGGDTGIAISPDRHHATLTNGQTVYYGVKIAPEDREKVRGVTFILVTTPKIGIPNIRDNYFEIKYVESVGGSAGSVKPDTTAGKAYQVISPNGDYWYYFSFKAVIKSGGIHTEITPVFFGGPKVAAVAEKYIVCCWEQITTPLLNVPKCIPISWWYCFPIIDVRAIWAFQCALYKKIATNTANVPCTNPEATGKSLTILGAGFNALKDTPLAQAIHITDEAGQAATVTWATIVSDNEIAATIDVDRCLPGIKCVTIDGAQGHGNVTFIEVINDMPPTMLGEMGFCAAVVRGTCDKVPLTLTTTGEHVAFYTGILNVFNVTKTTTCTPTQVSFFTCGNPTNAGSYIIKGTTNPGKQMMSEYLGEPLPNNLVTNQKQGKNNAPPLDIDVDLNNDANFTEDDPDEHTNPGKLLCENDDHDNGDISKNDNADGLINGTDDKKDMAILKIRKINAMLPDGSKLILKVSDKGIVRIFDHQGTARIGPNPPDADSYEIPMNLISGSNGADRDWLVEGVKPGNVTITLKYDGPLDPAPDSDSVTVSVTNVDLADKDGHPAIPATKNGGTGGVNHFVATVTDLPAGQKVRLKIARTKGSSGSAKFVSTNSDTMEIAESTDPIKVLGGDQSDVARNMELQAFLPRDTTPCATTPFTVFWTDPTTSLDSGPVPDTATGGTGIKLKAILTLYRDDKKNELGYCEKTNGDTSSRGFILLRFKILPAGIPESDLKNGGPNDGFDIHRRWTARSYKVAV